MSLLLCGILTQNITQVLIVTSKQPGALPSMAATSKTQSTPLPPPTWLPATLRNLPTKCTNTIHRLASLILAPKRGQTISCGASQNPGNNLSTKQLTRRCLLRGRQISTSRILGFTSCWRVLWTGRLLIVGWPKDPVAHVGPGIWIMDHHKSFIWLKFR